MRSILSLAATTAFVSAQNWGQRIGCNVPVIKKQFDCAPPQPQPVLRDLVQEPQRCGCPMPPPLPVRDPCTNQDIPPPAPVTPAPSGCGCQPVVRAPEPVSCAAPVREPETKEVCEDVQIQKSRQVMKECKKVIMERQERTRTTQVPKTTYKTVMKKKFRTVYKTVNKQVQKTRMVPKETFEEKKVCRQADPIPEPVPQCGCQAPAPVFQPQCGCPRQQLNPCSCPQPVVQQPQCGCSAPVARAPPAPVCDIQKIKKVIMVPETYMEDCPEKVAVQEAYEEPCKVPQTVFEPKVEKYWVNCPKTVTEQCPSTEMYTVTEKKCRTITIPLPEPVREPQTCNPCGCCQEARAPVNQCGACNAVAPVFLNEEEPEQSWSGSGSTTNGWQLAP